MDYKGIKCPVCEKPFSEDDDIVVCPSCGAPHHRECYQKEGHCAFSEQHVPGFVWEAPAVGIPIAPDTDSEDKDRLCPRCGRMNAHSALFCDKCGQSLSGDPNQFGNSPAGYGVAPGVPFGYDPMGGVNPEETLDDDVSMANVARFVQNSTAYYLPVFQKIKKSGKSRFHFSAFLFSGGWFLYRKLYKLGTILTAVMLLLMLASTYFSYTLTSDVLLKLLNEAGISVSAGVSYADLIKASEFLPNHPASDIFLLLLPSILNFLGLVVMIVSGAIANRMYYKHCIRHVRGICASSPDESQRLEAFKHRGGVNVPLAVCILISYLIVTYLPQFIL